MSSYIKRGESVFFQFRNGKSVLSSQCKPRMFKTAEKATLGVNYVDTDEIVEYREVTHCKDCKWYKDLGTNYRLMDCSHEKGLEDANETDFCSYGERREDDA